MEWLFTLAGIHLLACLSPGPDILLVIKTRLQQGTRAAMRAVAGILTGVTLHIALGLTGVSLILSQDRLWVAILSAAGGGWLIYLGYAGWPRRKEELQKPAKPAAKAPVTEGYLNGLLVNLLNPKAFFYFISLFTLFLSPEMSLSRRTAGALVLLTSQGIAFSAVAIFLPKTDGHRFLRSIQHPAQIVLSLVFIGLGLWIWGEALGRLS